MWKKIRKNNFGYDFDYVYRGQSPDGAREQLRLVIYPDTPKGKIQVYYDKIRRTEDTWEKVAGSAGWVWASEVEQMYGIKINDRLSKVINAIKDIFNDTRNKRDIH